MRNHMQTFNFIPRLNRHLTFKNPATWLVQNILDYNWRTRILPDIEFAMWNVYVCVSGGKKCSFFGKFGVLCFLETAALRFTPLPHYRRIRNYKNFRFKIIPEKLNEKFVLFFHMREKMNFPQIFKYQNYLTSYKNSEITDREKDGLTDRQRWFHWTFRLQWSKKLDNNWSRPDVVNINFEHTGHSIQNIHSIVPLRPKGWEGTWVIIQNSTIFKVFTNNFQIRVVANLEFWNQLHSCPS